MISAASFSNPVQGGQATVGATRLAELNTQAQKLRQKLAQDGKTEPPATPSGQTGTIARELVSVQAQIERIILDAQLTKLRPTTARADPTAMPPQPADPAGPAGADSPDASAAGSKDMPRKSSGQAPIEAERSGSAGAAKRAGAAAARYEAIAALEPRPDERLWGSSSPTRPEWRESGPTPLSDHDRPQSHKVP